MVRIIATAESVEQARRLVEAGVDTLYIGQDAFGLRLPYSFSREEMRDITEFAHRKGRKVMVALNALMHNEQIRMLASYVQFLESIEVDAVTVGDPGVIQVMRNENIDLPYVYDAQTMVVSARQVNFWVKRGAVGAVLARELTCQELQQISEQVTVPLEVLVYGATCIHHSKRPLVGNYFRFTEQNEAVSKARGLFLSEPKAPETHYSVYEDGNGTHIFANDDVQLMLHLERLWQMGLRHWKLDGIFTKGQRFVEIAKLFVRAKNALLDGTWTEQLGEDLHMELVDVHPEERTLSEGFFLKDPSEVK